MEIHAREYLLDIPFWTKKKNTLEQVRAFLEELGNPDEELQIIHVAGTNGKGSVCADLTSVLREAGYHRYLCLSSPGGHKGAFFAGRNTGVRGDF